MKNQSDPFSKNSDIWTHRFFRKQKATLDLPPSYNIVMENSDLFQIIQNETPVTPPQCKRCCMQILLCSNTIPKENVKG